MPKEQSIVNCAEQIDEMVVSNTPDSENVVIDGIVVDMSVGLFYSREYTRT